MVGGPIVGNWIPYCGVAPEPAELMARWNFDPLLLAAIGGGTALFYWRFRPGRERLAPFAAGFAILLLLFVSPFCALTSALFAARAAHHALLVAAAAPLIVLALPDGMRVRGSIGLWTAMHALVLWAWHYPPFYASALSSDAIYWLMQASLLGSALAFWLSVRRAAMAAAVGALLATMVQMGLLGALITFAGRPLYAPHWLTTTPWGLSPLEDQQLAGLIMWAPAAAVYLVAALLVAGRWLHGEARAAA